MVRFFPWPLDAGLNENDAESLEANPLESVDTVSVASADLDGVVFTTTAGGQIKNYVSDTAKADPTVTEIFPTEPWPSVSELTTYPAQSETPAIDISATVYNTPISISPLDAVTSYSPSALPSPSATSSASSPGSKSSYISSSSTTSASRSTSTESAAAAAQTTDSTSDSTAFSGGTSTTTKIAIAVPVSVVGIALIFALLFLLARRRRRERERNALPPPYDIATRQINTLSTQELMIAAKSSTLEPRSPPPTPGMAMPMQIPVINISPSTEDRGRTPSPGPSPRSSSVNRMSAHGPGDSEAELGVAVAVPIDQRHSATEQELRGRVGSVGSSRGPSRLARMPFEDFEDDEIGIGIAVSGDDDDAVSDVSDTEGRRGREREYDVVSVVSSFEGVSPIGQHEGRQFR